MTQKVLTRKQQNQPSITSQNTSLVSQYPSVGNSFSVPSYLQSQQIQNSVIHPINQASILDEDIEIDADEVMIAAHQQPRKLQSSYQQQFNITSSQRGQNQQQVANEQSYGKSQSIPVLNQSDKNTYQNQINEYQSSEMDYNQGKLSHQQYNEYQEKQNYDYNSFDLAHSAIPITNSIQELQSSEIPMPHRESARFDAELQQLEATYQQTPKKPNRYYQESVSDTPKVKYSSFPSVELKNQSNLTYEPFQTSFTDRSSEVSQDFNQTTKFMGNAPPKPHNQVKTSQNLLKPRSLQVQGNQTNNIVTDQRKQIQELEKLVQKYSEECERQQKVIKQLSTNSSENKQLDGIPAHELRLQLERERYAAQENERLQYQTIKQLKEIVEQKEESWSQNGQIIEKIMNVLQLVERSAIVPKLEVLIREGRSAVQPAVYVEQLKGAMDDIRQLQQLVRERDEQIQQLQNKGGVGKSGVNANQYGPADFEKEGKIKQLEGDAVRLRMQLLKTQQSADLVQLQEQLDMARNSVEQVQQLRQFDQKKLKAQEEEYSERIRELESHHSEFVADIRRNCEGRIQAEKQKQMQLEGKLSIIQDQFQDLETRHRKLKEDSSVERFNEMARRINQIEQLPDGRYGREIMERAIKAEQQLQEERAKYQKNMAEKEDQIAGFQVEIAALMDELQGLMTGY